MTRCSNWYDKLGSFFHDDDVWRKGFEVCEAANKSLDEAYQTIINNLDRKAGEQSDLATYMRLFVLKGFNKLPYQSFMPKERIDQILSNVSPGRYDSTEVYQGALYASETLEQCISIQLFGGDINNQQFVNVLLVGLLNYSTESGEISNNNLKKNIIEALRDGHISPDLAQELVLQAIKQLKGTTLQQLVTGCYNFVAACASKKPTQNGIYMTYANDHLSQECLVSPQSIRLDRLVPVPSEE